MLKRFKKLQKTQSSLIPILLCIGLMGGMLASCSKSDVADIFEGAAKLTPASGAVSPSPSDPAEEPPPEEHTITLSFVGDCMVASMLGSEDPWSFNYFANQVEPSYFFEKVKHIFEADDWTVANCENVFTDRELSPAPKPGNPVYWYRSKTANTAVFTEGSIEVVSVANNHSGDYGEEGLSDTTEALDKAGVLWGNNGKTLLLEKYGFTVALYCTTLYATWQADPIIEWLSEVEAISDYQIVYYHGGTERVYVPDAWRVYTSKQIVDAGADLVIGGHPHVLQPMEEYNGAQIVHSLGNFMFGGQRYPENRTIIYQKILTVKGGELLSEDYNIIPCYCFGEDWQPAVIEDEDEYNSVISYMHGEAATPFG